MEGRYRGGGIEEKPRTIFRIITWTRFDRCKKNNIWRDVSGARVPKIILFDLLCSAEPLFRIIALTSLNSIVKCNYIFDQLGSMFSVVLLFFFFFSPPVYVTLILARAFPVLWYLITFSINVKMYVAACVVCFSNRWKGFFASWIKGFFFRSSFLDLNDWICEFNYGMD